MLRYQTSGAYGLSAPLDLFGRQAQFQRITQVLARDEDLLIAEFQEVDGEL